MFQPDVSADGKAWRQRAAALAAKLNFHHFLSRVVPKLFFLLAAAALFELFRRQMNGPARLTGAMLLLGAAVAGAWAWLEGRRHFCTENQALVRLETVLGLHNRLSCAESNVVPWPRASRERIDDGYHPNWKLIVVPVLAGLLFFYAAHRIPIHKIVAAATAGAIAEPPDFAQVQSWLNALKAADVIEPDKLADMQSALDRLRQRSPQDWYTQSSLEAADSLKELMEQSMNSLEQGLDQADQSAEAMKSGEENAASASSLRAAEEKLSEAGDNLASGNLPLKRELVDQMKDGASTDKPLSAAQLAALQKRLAQGKLAAQTAAKMNGGFGDEMNDAIGSAMSGGLAHRRMVRPGPGGLGGGTESAPLVLQQRDRETPQGALTGVTNDDLSRTSLGDTIKITASTPKVDPAAYQGNAAAGAAHVAGNGGEAVWRSTYDPQEADVLSRFFK
jgi:Skp family chaperone for outer membrane proteins